MRQQQSAEAEAMSGQLFMPWVDWFQDEWPEETCNRR